MLTAVHIAVEVMALVAVVAYLNKKVATLRTDVQKSFEGMSEILATHREAIVRHEMMLKSILASRVAGRQEEEGDDFVGAETDAPVEVSGVVSPQGAPAPSPSARAVSGVSPDASQPEGAAEAQTTKATRVEEPMPVGKTGLPLRPTGETANSFSVMFVAPIPDFEGEADGYRPRPKNAKIVELPDGASGPVRAGPERGGPVKAGRSPPARPTGARSAPQAPASRSPQPAPPGKAPIRRPPKPVEEDDPELLNELRKIQERRELATKRSESEEDVLELSAYEDDDE